LAIEHAIEIFAPLAPAASFNLDVSRVFPVAVPALEQSTVVDDFATISADLPQATGDLFFTQSFPALFIVLFAVLCIGPCSILYT